MSRMLYLHVQLDIPLDGRLVKAVVGKGKELGCVYLKKHYGTSLLESTDFLSSEEVMSQILRGIAYIDEHPDFLQQDIAQLPQVCVRLENVFFSIFFSKNEGLSSMRLDPSVYIWYKNNDEQGGYTRGAVDWERYVCFMFALCKEFTIVSIETYDSSYQE